MNATTFFSEEMYHNLVQDIKSEKILHPSETPYQKTHKVNGNTYRLQIVTGRYKYAEAYGQYYVSLWDDYNYSDSNGSRNIGGSTGRDIELESYEAFKKIVNKKLSHFPDYKAEEETPVQLWIDF